MNKRRQTLKPLENKGFFCLSLLYRNGILTPVCSFTWAFLSWPCRSAWGTKRYRPHLNFMAICTRMCMAMWPNSFRTVLLLICPRQHGKMHKKAYNFGMWYTSGTLEQNKSPESQYLQGFPGFLQLFKLGVSFVALNYICLSFMQIHTVFYFNYIIYSGLLIFCCQNVATLSKTLGQ